MSAAQKLAEYLDRQWRNSSEFALLNAVTPVVMIQAYLWHHLDMDAPAPRLALASYALGRAVSNFAELTEREIDALYDVAEELKHGPELPAGDVVVQGECLYMGGAL